MTLTLVRKLLRDSRLALIAVALLIGLFQLLWFKITDRIIGQLAPFFNTLASLGGLSARDVQNVIFEGPGKIIRTIIGGEQIDLNGAMDMLSIGYVHPLMVTTSTSRWASTSRERGSGWASSSSMVPRSISPAMAPAARPMAQMQRMTMISGWT